MPTEAATTLYAGLDLHKTNVFCALIDQHGKPIYRRRLPTELPRILGALDPYRSQLKAVAVESTFNWYWLVDGLQAADYPVRLANPAAMDKYTGLKQTDDESDALWLAEMLRLGILPEGYIYPQAERPVRDMLRRRMLIVRQATQTLLSLQSMVTRHTGQSESAAKLQDWTLREVRATFGDPYSQQTAAALLELLGEQRRIQHGLEKQVLAVMKLTGPFQRLLTLPGIGNILGLSIQLESGPITRFASAGHYASYCRAVNSRCESDGKKKGEANRKNGNKYLAWAYVEAANFAQRYSPRAQGWFARKAARAGRVVPRHRMSGWRASWPRPRSTCCATTWTSTRTNCLEKPVAAAASPQRGWPTTTRCDWERLPPHFHRRQGSPVLPASRANEGWTAPRSDVGAEPWICEPHRMDTMRY